MKKNMICISCPMGCHLEAEFDEKKTVPEEIKITGNRCPRGIIYGQEEILSPKRMVTCTVSIDSKIQNRLSVKTDKPIEKKWINPLLKDLYKMKITPPVKKGDTILKNYEKTEVSIIATMTLGE